MDDEYGGSMIFQLRMALSWSEIETSGNLKSIIAGSSGWEK